MGGMGGDNAWIIGWHLKACELHAVGKERLDASHICRAGSHLPTHAIHVIEQYAACACIFVLSTFGLFGVDRMYALGTTKFRLGAYNATHYA